MMSYARFALHESQHAARRYAGILCVLLILIPGASPVWGLAPNPPKTAKPAATVSTPPAAKSSTPHLHAATAQAIAPAPHHHLLRNVLIAGAVFAAVFIGMAIHYHLQNEHRVYTIQPGL